LHQQAAGQSRTAAKSAKSRARAIRWRTSGHDVWSIATVDCRISRQTECNVPTCHARLCFNTRMTLVRFPAIALLMAACAAKQTPTTPGADATTIADADLSNTSAQPAAAPVVAAEPAAVVDPTTVADPRMNTDDGLVALLRDLGMGVVEALEPGAIRFRLEGQMLALFRDADNDLQLYYGVGGIRCPYEAINEWNKDHRFSRAYADDQSDMVLESDLIADGGLSRAKVEVFVNTFRVSVITFTQHMMANCQSTP
jgi:hypothetical protein